MLIKAPDVVARARASGALFSHNNSSKGLFHHQIKKDKTMFGLFKKDPVKKLEKKYLKLMEEAMAIQRGGDIKAYAEKSAEAEEVAKEIEALKAKQEEG